jgi:valyl-tRNA synthetase
MNVPPAAVIPMSVSGGGEETLRRLQAHDTVIRRLARVDRIALADTPVKGAVQIITGSASFSLPLGDVIDVEAERARLLRELEKVGSDIAKIQAKLNNPQFVERAKEEVVEEQRERLAEAEALKAKTEAALARLST